MQTIMQNIPTAVLSLDADEAVTHVNDALIRLFRPQSAEHARPTEKLALADFFPANSRSSLRRLMRSADRMGSTSAQMEMVSRRRYPGSVGDGGLNECAPQRADCSAPAARIRRSI